MIRGSSVAPLELAPEPRRVSVERAIERRPSFPAELRRSPPRSAMTALRRLRSANFDRTGVSRRCRPTRVSIRDPPASQFLPRLSASLSTRLLRHRLLAAQHPRASHYAILTSCATPLLAPFIIVPLRFSRKRPKADLRARNLRRRRAAWQCC